MILKNNQIKQIEEIINIDFSDKKLLEQAFIHRSYLNETSDKSVTSNEKMEFLGDSILSLITSVYLYKNYPRLHEGEYTSIKAALVRTESLYKAAKKISIGRFMLLSKGESEQNGSDNMSILADAYEALIAAIFLDGGFEKANTFVLQTLLDINAEEIVKGKLYTSSKNQLQEYIQEKYKKLPIYEVIDESGPEHLRQYTVGVYYEGKLLGKGQGRSKKSAQESAAEIALRNLNKI